MKPAPPPKIKVPFLDLHAGYIELKNELDEAYHRVMDSGWYILGDEVEKFEEEFAMYCEAENSVGVGNGLEALQLVLMAMDIGPGDEVIVPGMTFIATWLAVSHVGATPVPVDIYPGLYNIDVSLIERAITQKTKAIIPVHLYGQPADMDAILNIAKENHLRIIEDAAQAHGARYKGRRVGSLGDAAAFSFYPGKNLGAFGDGGSVVTNDKDLYRRLLRLRDYGAERKYHHVEKGLNSRLDPLQAAFLSVKLKHLDEWNQRRRSVAKCYLESLSACERITLPSVSAFSDSVWHLFVIASDKRDELQQSLHLSGIRTQIHYPSPVYDLEPYRSGDYPEMLVADSHARKCLSIPIGPHLDNEQIDFIVHEIIRL